MKIPKKKATFCIILHQNGIIGHKIGCECPEKSVLVFEGAGGIVESKNERQKMEEKVSDPFNFSRSKRKKAQKV